MSSIVLQKPIVTEKAAAGLEKGRYIFKVDVAATKGGVKQEIESVFDVKVKKVWVMNVKSRARRFGMTIGQTKRYKKAIVQLQHGQTLPLYQTA